MATTKQSFPADSVSLTVSGLASLGSSSTFVAGYCLDAISNRTNLDLDHQLSLAIKVGTTPTINTQIQIWAIAARSVASGTVSWPACFSSSYTGTAGAFTVNSAGVLYGVGRLISTLTVDSTTTGRVYDLAGLGIAQFYGGSLPIDWTYFITHNTGVALDSTGGSFVGTYTRIQTTTA